MLGLQLLLVIVAQFLHQRLGITAIRKNRSENGIRADLLGSKPHSKGDLFSRSSMSFFDSRDVTSVMIVDNDKATVDVAIIIVIIYLVDISNFLIGSQVYLLY
jgi:hypothetical protein